MKICHIFTLTGDIEKRISLRLKLFTADLLAKFHENSTLPGGIDSMFESADSLPRKLNQLRPIRSDFHEILRGVSAGKYFQVYGEFFSISAVKVKMW